MGDIQLPNDLVAFLSEGRQLNYDTSKCEPGQIKLVPYGTYQLGEVWIKPDSHPAAAKNPHAGEKGYYAIPAINLVSQAKGYNPQFILLWLPESGEYGTWDCDHWELRVFPGVTWTDIAASPLKYINAQWYPDDVENEVLVPWPKYAFKKGRPL